MANFKLSQAAENDLIRIHQRGIETHGEAKADQYFYAFFKRFEQIAIDPYLYPAVDDIRDGYRRSVCGVDNIYYRVVVGGVEIVRILGRQDTKELP